MIITKLIKNRPICHAYINSIYQLAYFKKYTRYKK